MNNDLLRLINERHSVRKYKQEPIENEKKQDILRYIEKLKAESGLDIKFTENTKKLFNFILKLIGWKMPPAAIVIKGQKSPQAEEKCGYYGEKLVLYLQSIGINTCWVGMFNKNSEEAQTGDPILTTIAVGYGENCGRVRKSKKYEDITDVRNGDEWFKKGVECALKAPTAVNQQKFKISIEDGKPVISISSNGSFVYVDLGIARYHFEVGSGKECEVKF